MISPGAAFGIAAVGLGGALLYAYRDKIFPSKDSAEKIDENEISDGSDASRSPSNATADLVPSSNLTGSKPLSQSAVLPAGQSVSTDSNDAECTSPPKPSTDQARKIPLFKAEQPPPPEQQPAPIAGLGVEVIDGVETYTISETDFYKALKPDFSPKNALPSNETEAVAAVLNEWKTRIAPDKPLKINVVDNPPSEAISLEEANDMSSTDKLAHFVVDFDEFVVYSDSPNFQPLDFSHYIARDEKCTSFDTDIIKANFIRDPEYTYFFVGPKMNLYSHELDTFIVTDKDAEGLACVQRMFDKLKLFKGSRVISTQNGGNFYTKGVVTRALFEVNSRVRNVIFIDSADKNISSAQNALPYVPKGKLLRVVKFDRPNFYKH